MCRSHLDDKVEVRFDVVIRRLSQALGRSRIGLLYQQEKPLRSVDEQGLILDEKLKENDEIARDLAAHVDVVPPAHGIQRLQPVVMSVCHNFAIREFLWRAANSLGQVDR